MEGEEFETDKPMDILKLEELKAEMCFVSENVDKDNARMGERETKVDQMQPFDGTADYRFDPADKMKVSVSLVNCVLSFNGCCVFFFGISSKSRGRHEEGRSASPHEFEPGPYQWILHVGCTV